MTRKALASAQIFQAADLMKRIPSILKKTLVSIIVVFVFGSMLELCCRVKYELRRIQDKELFEHDKEKFYQLKKNFTGEYAGFPASTNSSGYRDSEIPLKKAPNTIRILVLGDSVSFGHGIHEKDSYPESLEKMLNRDAPHRQWDVINTAAPGNALRQELIDLKRGMRFEPDVAIVQFCLNDISEPYWVFRQIKGIGINPHAVGYVSYYHYLLSRHSAFYLFLNDAKSRFKRHQEKNMIENMVIRPDTPQIKEAWNSYLGDLGSIIELTNAHEIPLIFVASPYAFQFKLDPAMAYPQRILRDFLKDKNIRFVDLMPLFRNSHPNGHRKYFLDDSHLSPAGHLLLAKTISPLIVRAIPPKKSPSVTSP